MGSKLWYSTPLLFYWQDIYKQQKKFTPTYSDEQIFHVLKRQQLNSPLVPGESKDQRESFISGLELWFQDASEKLLHIFFLEKELRDALKEMRLVDIESISSYIYEHGTETKVVYLETNQKRKSVVFNYGLHIPREKHGYGFSTILFQNGTVELFFVKGNLMGRMDNKLYLEYAKKQDDYSIKLCSIFRLGINTLAYMQCFPECVSEGVPKISKSKQEMPSSNSVIVNQAASFKAESPDYKSKTPHFRKGHFRVLKSDRYKNKKGQIIFVKETMVKGRAITVSKTDNMERLESSSRKLLD